MTVVRAEAGARNQNAIVRLGAEELEERGALLATNWAMRVDFIEELMTGVVWTPGAGRHLAALWKLSGSAISMMSSEASRRILKAYRDAPEEVVARLCAGLDHVVQIALGKERSIGCKQCGSVTTHPDPDCNAAIKGQVALAQVLGLAPNRHDMELRYEALDDVALMRTVIRAAMGTPHLRPILLAELEEARGGLAEAVAANEAGSLVPLPARDQSGGIDGGVPEQLVLALGDGRSAAARAARVSAALPLDERLPCRCGHAASSHYLSKACWQCANSGCLAYEPSSDTKGNPE